jgi:hypothetical protein
MSCTFQMTLKFNQGLCNHVQYRDLLPATKFAPVNVILLSIYYPLKKLKIRDAITNPSSLQLLLFFLLSTELLNYLSHNLSFGHMKTHPMIDPNIETFQKVPHPGHTMFWNFRCISYKDKRAFETTRKFSGKRRSS